MLAELFEIKSIAGNKQGAGDFSFHQRLLSLIRHNWGLTDCRTKATNQNEREPNVES
jgi:hypothetical protein